MEIGSVAVGMLWGTLLSHYIWFKKRDIYEGAKQKVFAHVGKFWKTSTNQHNNYPKQNSTRNQQNLNKNIDDLIEINAERQIQEKILQEKQKNDQKILKEKKIAKAAKSKPKNLRKYTKNYEEWFINSRQMKKIKQSPLFLDEQLKRLDQRRNSQKHQIQINFQKKESEQDDLKHFLQKYEDYEDEDYPNILGYNPLVESDSNQKSSF